jgi:hypothetical protein
VPYVFGFGQFEPRMDWAVNFYRWPDTSAKTLSVADFEAVVRGLPLFTRQERRLDYMWYRPAIAGLPATRWAAVASTPVTLGPGLYTLRTISDDAIRVWVDGVLVIDNWAPHESAVNHASITSGRHTVRVAYAQVDGWTELRVEIVRGVERSEGSAGPH